MPLVSADQRVGEVIHMHQIIYALVEASTEDDALVKGKATFDRLVGAELEATPVFDYYMTFDNDSSTVAGKARWGEMPVVAPVESDDGEALLERGWEATKDEFERNLDRVSELVEELTTDELMHNKGLARNACHNLGAYRGPSLFLYDESGSGIRHREQLDGVLDSDEQLWILPADVHY